MALQNRLQETVAAVDTCIAANWQDDSSETREATQIADAYLALRAVKAQLEETTLLCQPKKTVGAADSAQHDYYRRLLTFVPRHP